MSIAVFTYDEDFLYTLSAILYFHHCHTPVSEHVTFHLSFPKDRAPSDPISLLHVAQRRLSCSKRPEKIGTDQYVQNYQPLTNGTEYPPINMLRSLSLRMAVTSYVFPVDVDLVPSARLRSDFIQNSVPTEISLNGTAVINNSRSVMRLAYTVPVFERKRGLTVPSDKSALLQAWARNEVRPFRQRAQCSSPPCQEPTNYQRWRTLPQSKELQASYTVGYQPRYEPYLLAQSPLPLFDERFRHYGDSRYSQVSHLTARAAIQEEWSFASYVMLSLVTSALGTTETVDMVR